MSLSSLASLTEAGYRDAYLARLAGKHLDTLRAFVAGASLPLLGTAAPLPEEMGVSSPEIVSQPPRFMGRAFQVRRCCAPKMGLKEVRVEVHGGRLFDYACFRSSACGLLMAVLDRLCTRIYGTEFPGRRPARCAFIRIQWA